ncbi:hypothetical protein X777_16592, partial [Ooceraea biroi]
SLRRHENRRPRHDLPSPAVSQFSLPWFVPTRLFTYLPTYLPVGGPVAPLSRGRGRATEQTSSIGASRGEQVELAAATVRVSTERYPSPILGTPCRGPNYPT